MSKRKIVFKVWIKIAFFIVFSISYLAKGTAIGESKNGLLVIKPQQIEWVNVEINDSRGLKFLKYATVSIPILNCEKEIIPIRVIYKSNLIRNSFSGYYLINSMINKRVNLKIFDFESFVGNSETIFDHIEVDSSFENCFGGIITVKPSSNSIVLSVNQSNNHLRFLQSKSKSLGEPIYFQNLYSENLHLNLDSSYVFKGLIKPKERILSTYDWQKICNPVANYSRFEFEVLGRPIVCGLTYELASLDGYKLKKGEVVNIVGSVSVGSATLVISRTNGGLVKVASLNRGEIMDKFIVPIDGSYNIFLSTNIFVYDYPFLSFKISMTNSSIK